MTREVIEAYRFATVKSTSNTAYATNYDITVSEISWSCPGNQNFDGYVRIGGKSITNVERVIYSKEKINSQNPFTVSKITVNHNGVSNSNLTVNSVKIVVANDANFENTIETITLTPSFSASTSGSFDFTPTQTWSSECYYKFIINVTNSKSSNYGLDLNSIVFYKESAPSTDPSLSVSPASIAFGEKAIGGSYEETFTVTYANLTEDLTVTGFEGISVSPTTIEVGDGTGSAEVNVTYAPTAVGNIEGNITVSNTDDEVSATVAVTGSAYDPSNVDTYELYTGTLVEGDYVIYYSGKAMKNTVPSNRLDYMEITPVNDVITNPEATIIWHIAPNGTNWTIYNATVAKYAAGNGTKNQAALVETIGTDGDALWSVENGESTFDFTNSKNSNANVNATLRNNTTYGFACYSTSTGGALSLYKLVNANQVATPTFSPVAGTYYETQNVTITCATEDATIYYTTDGTTPSASNGTQYTTAITVAESMTIKAIAVKAGMDDSDVATAAYVITLPSVATPTFSPAAGTYTTSQSVEISCTTEGATIYYTTDGTAPTTSSNVYNGAIEINTTTTLKAIAVKDGMVDSDVPSATYNIVTIEHAGTEADPYTVADARNVIGAYGTINEAYVRGIVCQVDSYNSTYKSITYWISDDGTTTTMLEVYSGKGIGGADFNSINDIQVNDSVTVKGELKKYNSTYEFSLNNQLVSLKRTVAGDANGQAELNGIDAGMTYIVPNGVTLTFTGTNNGTASNLIIEDGGQLVTSSAVNATMKKIITAYTSSKDATSDGWYFIASPLTTSTAPTAVGNLVAATPENYDLYQLNPSTIKWENYKENEGNAAPGFNLENGRGYLYANKDLKTLEFAGAIKPYSEESSANQVSVSEGWNLIGNPFTCNVYANRAFYKMNDDKTAVEAVSAGPTPIAPCTGIVVEADADGTVTFSKTAPEDVSNNGALNVVLAKQVTDRGGVSTGSTTAIDKAIVSFNRDSQLGKFYFGTQDANLYLPQSGKEFAIVNAESYGELPLNFLPNESGAYTLSVDPEGVEMNYLHLIDNLTGADTDLLRQSEYSFTATRGDYPSRFRLVFSANTHAGDDSHNDFAFVSDGDIIVTDDTHDATLQVVDVTGRTLLRANGANRVSTNGMAPGVYVLQLLQGEQMRTQKIVVK